MEYVSNWVTDKVAGYAKTGIQAGGSLAGNAVGGVGTLVENSGRSVGQSANGIAGAIGGVGSYINNYGQTVQNSMAADGPVGGGGGAAKKTAVRPSSTKTPSSAAGSNANASKALPSSTTRAMPKSGATSSLPAKSPPSSRPATNLPSKKPAPIEPAAAKNYPSKPPQNSRTANGKAAGGVSPASTAKPAAAKRFDNSKRPSISTSQSERTADGKVRISAASRPRPVKA